MHTTHWDRLGPGARVHTGTVEDCERCKAKKEEGDGNPDRDVA